MSDKRTRDITISAIQEIILILENNINSRTQHKIRFIKTFVNFMRPVSLNAFINNQFFAVKIHSDSSQSFSNH